MKPFLWRDLALLPQRAVWRAAERTLVRRRRAHRQGRDVSRRRPARARGNDARKPGAARRLDRGARSQHDSSCSAISSMLAKPTATPRSANSWPGEARRARARDPARPRQPRRARRRAAGRARTRGRQRTVTSSAAIECRHHPLDDRRRGRPRVLAGHTHPVARLRGPGTRQRPPALLRHARAPAHPAGVRRIHRRQGRRGRRRDRALHHRRRASACYRASGGAGEADCCGATELSALSH